jgi:hypothetical protein
LRRALNSSIHRSVRPNQRRSAVKRCIQPKSTSLSVSRTADLGISRLPVQGTKAAMPALPPPPSEAGTSEVDDALKTAMPVPTPTAPSHHPSTIADIPEPGLSTSMPTSPSQPHLSTIADISEPSFSLRRGNSIIALNTGLGGFPVLSSLMTPDASGSDDCSSSGVSDTLRRLGLKAKQNVHTNK